MAGSASLAAAVALAKGQQGLALAANIERVLRSKDAFQFGELLELPSVRALADDASPALRRAHALLQLLATGTWGDYARDPGAFGGELEPALRVKLKVVSLLTLAASRKVLPYAELMPALGADTQAELEDVVIAAVYSGLLAARMDQRAQVVEVAHCAGRDVRLDAAQLEALRATLAGWAGAIDAAAAALTGQVEALTAQREGAKHARESHDRMVSG